MIGSSVIIIGDSQLGKSMIDILDKTKYWEGIKMPRMVGRWERSNLDKLAIER